MIITEELDIEVDNGIYHGPCRMCVVDQPDRFMYDNINSIRNFIVEGREYCCYIALATVTEGDQQYERVHLYVLSELNESWIGKSISSKDMIC